MKKEKELLNRFELEELEQRFEMGWRFKKADIQTPNGNSQDGFK